MLPVYEAVGFKEIIKKGGRTKPWVVLVATDEGIKPYVVKLFTAELIQKRFSVECEVLANIIAKDFDLPVANAAFINFSDEFIRSLPLEPHMQLEKCDTRMKFGSSLIYPSNPFYPDLPKEMINNRISLDTTFAFDVLIRNRDRTGSKPNMLVAHKIAYLIDHELGFEEMQEGSKQIKINHLDRRFAEWHIFYSYLKKATNYTKGEYFNEFEEYLRWMNVKQLGTYFDQLGSFGYATRKDIIVEYLQHVQQNSSNFVKLLKGVLL